MGDNTGATKRRIVSELDVGAILFVLSDSNLTHGSKETKSYGTPGEVKGVSL